MTVMYPPPMSWSLTTSTSAALLMASAASTTPMAPFVSIRPKARTRPSPSSLSLRSGTTAVNSLCGRGITWTECTSPTLAAAVEPASTADLTAATSPEQNTVTKPEPTRSQPKSWTLAALAMASPASTTPTSPTGFYHTYCIRHPLPPQVIVRIFAFNAPNIPCGHVPNQSHCPRPYRCELLDARAR